ncbi:hypothetical protein F5Y15DRAFT_411055 [Xylariaceae sp. FL0016]|nr:hypothetical protein F5Y15DRAFT_411055 [Xylariaceae sp. FL0016]
MSTDPVQIDGEHGRHHAQHRTDGLRTSLRDIMNLIYPTFVSRTTGTSVEKDQDDDDWRQSNLSMLKTLVESKPNLERKIWQRTPRESILPDEVSGSTYDQALSEVEEYLLGMLMEPRAVPRRMW